MLHMGPPHKIFQKNPLMGVFLSFLENKAPPPFFFLDKEKAKLGVPPENWKKNNTPKVF